MVHILDEGEEALLQAEIIALEREGLVTRTFRRLDADRQLAVIEAILDGAAAEGPTALSVKQVAGRAQVAVGSLYQYFPDRDAMLMFAARVSTRLLTAGLEAFRPALAAMPLRDALTAYLGGGVEWSRAYAGLLRFFARVAYQGDVGYEADVLAPVATAMRDTVAGILTAARARGELREGVDLQWAVRLTHALTIAVGDSQLLPHLNVYLQVVPEGAAGSAATAAAIDFIVAALGTEATGGER